ncbi:MAG: DsrH/TusB family sulfur metabolism protein [Nitrospiria bacterium]
MNRILHVLKEPHTPVALEMIRQEAKDPQQEVMILLIQEAVTKTLPLGDSLKTYVLKEDLEERGLTSPTKGDYRLIDFRGMLDLLYRVDKIVTW